MTLRNERVGKSVSNVAAIYLHVPFCHKICPYCDFNTFAVKKVPEEAYVQALIAEIDLLNSEYQFSELSLDSIYWGGGTPSIFSGESFTKIHSKLEDCFAQSLVDLEITIEANPNDITAVKSVSWKKAGINRVSIGSQSGTDRILKLLGRDHRSADITEAVRLLRLEGFENLSLDLIFGVPEQTEAELEADIQFYSQFEVEHLSTYSLTIEKGTPFFQAVANGSLTPLDDERARQQYQFVIQQLKQLGFLHYEVSNFARPGFYSRHNSNYWKRGTYFGVGAGAHSYSSELKKRWANVGRPERYQELLAKGEPPTAWQEDLSKSDELSELLLLTLRTSEGYSLSELERVCSPSQQKNLMAKFQGLLGEGLCEITEQVVLTEAGLCIADSIIEDLIASVGEKNENLKQEL